MGAERRGRSAAPSFVLVEALGAAGDELALPEEEARYVARVCRARAGERLTATDGLGALADLTLIDVAREVRARIDRIERRARSHTATVWCGAPEGERADWLIEKLAELGVARFQPLDTERASWKAGPARLARWVRLARAALKQSCQPWRMEIAVPARLDELTARPTPGSLWLADPGGERPPAGPTASESTGAIGPSQGFSAAERARLTERGFQAISLAAGRLRTETAALAWAAWWAGSSGGHAAS